MRALRWVGLICLLGCRAPSKEAPAADTGATPDSDTGHTGPEPEHTGRADTGSPPTPDDSGSGSAWQGGIRSTPDTCDPLMASTPTYDTGTATYACDTGEALPERHTCLALGQRAEELGLIEVSAAINERRGAPLDWDIDGGGDLSGDGQPDVVLTDCRDALIFDGPLEGSLSAGEAGQIVNVVAPDCACDDIGAVLAGDADGDGYEDLLVTARANAEVTLVAGPIASGPVTASALAWFDGLMDLDPVAPAAGDLNGDGLADLLFERDKQVTSKRTVLLFTSPHAGVFWASDAEAQIYLDDESGGVSRPSSGGDMNGDGIDDLVVTTSGGYGSVQVYYGPVAGSREVEDADAAEHGNAGFGCEIGDRNSELVGDNGAKLIGDTDGDGRADLILNQTCWNDYFWGYWQVWHAPTSTSSGLVNSLGIRVGDFDVLTAGKLGDTNADGFDDLLLGLREFESGGAAFVLQSPNDGQIFIDSEEGLMDYDVDFFPTGLTLRGAASSLDIGVDLSAAGDQNGDGYADLLVSGPGEDTVVWLGLMGP